MITAQCLGILQQN